MEGEQIDHRDVDSRIPLICLILTFVIRKPVFFDRILKTREKKKNIRSLQPIRLVNKLIKSRFGTAIKIIEFFLFCLRQSLIVTRI